MHHASTTVLFNKPQRGRSGFNACEYDASLLGHCTSGCTFPPLSAQSQIRDMLAAAGSPFSILLALLPAGAGGGVWPDGRPAGCRSLHARNISGGSDLQPLCCTMHAPIASMHRVGALPLIDRCACSPSTSSATEARGGAPRHRVCCPSSMEHRERAVNVGSRFTALMRVWAWVLVRAARRSASRPRPLGRTPWSSRRRRAPCRRWGLVSPASAAARVS